MAARNIDQKQFKSMMENGEVVLVDYWAPWCSYCRRITTAYDKVAEQYAPALDVVKINIDEEALLAEREQIEVIPTLVIYRGGKALGSVVAPESKAAIDAFIRETLQQ
jgi:thioredoxin